MSLKDKISADIKAAMKAKDKIRLETVRSIKKAMLEKEVSIRPSGRDELNEVEELELLSKLAKQRRDSIAQYQSAGRDDLVEQESEELKILEAYLPTAISEEELETAIDDIINSVQATSIKDMGKVMGVAIQKLRGRVDGSAVQKLVKAKLSG